MPSRTISLISSRKSASQRSQFAIFVPNASNADEGTLIQAAGAPMTGYALEFKRNYCPEDGEEEFTVFPIGETDSAHIVDSPPGVKSTDRSPQGDLETAAAEISTPGVCENFLAPVTDFNNKQSQEWTMEYIRHLVSKRLIDSDAIRIVQSKRDPPSHGVGLQSMLRGGS
ncbi:hypothetical protein N7468_005608 [Penicillium chermesinum]|uniref:Uncharacterized protein n=1 Tax=Penicillium chermesinum TaxID=63820 RepID=A0A9W9NZL7_9EURO|nr:uncharacterized protein N7468_005608 [Penicillium chermesinum]KAJ5232652.1 hypothetical protein N7468_005608 [Penicillium chermesinum]